MPARLRRLIAPAAIALAILCAGPVATAAAGNYGQLGAFGSYGTGSGRLSLPNIFGTEPDGSVFVGDQPNAYTSERIQKFSADGTLKGAVTIGTPNEEVFQGVAVDPAKGRFYVLRDHEGGDEETGKALSERILVFSTTPNAAGTLVAPAGGPATLPVPDGESPGGPLSIDDPTQLALDPHSGDLEILGTDRQGRSVLQRIGTDGGGSIGARYVEPPNGALAGAAIAIGPDGTTYIVRDGQDASQQRVGKLYTLPPDLSGQPVEIPRFSETNLEVPPSITQPGSGLNGRGPQISLSADGDLLYYKLLIGGSNGEFTPNKIEVVGYSLSEGNLRMIYGGGAQELECSIQTAAGALSSFGGSLAVLDPGPPEPPATFGDRVLSFGPGGSGCPAPSASLLLRSNSKVVSSVPSGSTVALDARQTEAGEAGLKGATWTIEGPEGQLVESVRADGAATFTVDHDFVNPGVYTVRLAIEVELHGSEQTSAGRLTFFGAAPQTLTVTGGGGGPPPTIAGLSPAVGPAGGENTVTISGSRFGGSPTVKFGSAPAANVKVVDPNTLTVTAPAGTPGRSVDVTVRTADGITPRTPADRYAYENGGGSGPGGGGTVTAVSPSHGPAAGGNVVTIFGVGLEDVDRVKFGNVDSSEVTAVNSSTVTAKVPPGVQGSTVHVIVVDSGGGASVPGSSDTYQYDPLMQGLGVVKMGSGNGTVISASGGINCGFECSAAFPQGATVALSASAASGSTFAGWGGACSGQGVCVVGMSATKGVVATFEAAKPPPAARAPVAPPAAKRAPKKLRCKKGTKLKKVGGKAKCVRSKPKKHPAKHRKKKHRKHGSAAERPHRKGH